MSFSRPFPRIPETDDSDVARAWCDLPTSPGELSRCIGSTARSLEFIYRKAALDQQQNNALWVSSSILTSRLTKPVPHMRSGSPTSNAAKEACEFLSCAGATGSIEAFLPAACQIRVGDI